MTFKDLPDGATNHIYNSWFQTAGKFYMHAHGWQLRDLHKFTTQEIHHLIWLLNEELKCRK